MNIVYKKTLKGVEEIALQSKNLAQRLRVYLLLVDGLKSVAELVANNHALPEIPMVLAALYDEGYIAIVSQTNSLPNSINNQAQAASATSPSPAPTTYAPTPTSNANINQIKNDMINAVTAVLGKDASLVTTKIQNAKDAGELFTLLMGLKKIITMYSGAEKAELFVSKFAFLASM